MALTFFLVFTCVINILFYRDLSTLKEEIDYKLDFYSRGLPFLLERFQKTIKPFRQRIIFLQKLIIVTVAIFIVFYIFIIHWVTKYSPLWIWKYLFQKFV
jgi:hypothetical protein